MKDKILETVITKCAETMARALRSYSGESMTCRIYIETRMHEHEGGDAYGYRVRYKPTQCEILDKANQIHYMRDEEGTEKIRRTEEVNDFQI